MPNWYQFIAAPLCDQIPQYGHMIRTFDYQFSSPTWYYKYSDILISYELWDNWNYVEMKHYCDHEIMSFTNTLFNCVIELTRVLGNLQIQYDYIA